MGGRSDSRKAGEEESRTSVSVWICMSSWYSPVLPRNLVELAMRLVAGTWTDQ